MDDLDNLTWTLRLVQVGVSRVLFGLDCEPHLFDSRLELLASRVAGSVLLVDAVVERVPLLGKPVHKVSQLGQVEFLDAPDLPVESVSLVSPLLESAQLRVELALVAVDLVRQSGLLGLPELLLVAGGGELFLELAVLLVLVVEALLESPLGTLGSCNLTSEARFLPGKVVVLVQEAGVPTPLRVALGVHRVELALQTASSAVASVPGAELGTLPALHRADLAPQGVGFAGQAADASSAMLPVAERPLKFAEPVAASIEITGASFDRICVLVLFAVVLGLVRANLGGQGVDAVAQAVLVVPVARVELVLQLGDQSCLLGGSPPEALLLGEVSLSETK